MMSITKTDCWAFFAPLLADVDLQCFCCVWFSVSSECANAISNETACCNAMDSYVSRLQEQSFITNLQALNCAASLGEKLLKANVSNVYNLCRINLKDFSLQEYGCLLPSLPSDATYDKTSGISFVCDLNDNIAAPWPSLSSESPSSCKKTNVVRNHNP
ncbi:GPI-anchored protein [Pyrus ussuriensis x Pyrus communis]|uniref:GPI-anchored protein n=1 Tax=Pyrus ussuriensis x Pyrus communis TaxID=2448454 RepID=A0A5N5GK22_9ROSA|nr:GPI-anchored protein [Pyrus ussuriensis x Pyrus communis]